MQYNDAVDRRSVYSFSYAVLVTAVVVVQCSAFGGAFQYDDFFAILINPHLEGWQAFVQHLGHMVRPVLHATFLLDRALYGNNPAGYHVLNLVLHVASTLIVYRVLALAVTESDRSVPFWTALVFFIHPLTTETITYISGRASGLMAFLYLSAFFLYIKASKEEDHAPVRRLYLAGAVVSYLLSFGAKETAMTFPFVLVLWDVLLSRRKAVSLRRSFFIYHVPFWLVLCAVALWAWRHPRYIDLAQFSLTLRPLWNNILSEVHAVAYAVLLFFIPWKQNFDHDLPEFNSPFEWPLPLDLALLAGLVVGAIIAARRLPLASFGVGWFLVLLLPTSLIPRADLLSERNLYPAFVGLALVTVVLASRFVKWLMRFVPHPRLVRFAATSGAIGLILVLCLCTYQRNLVYQDEISLWSDTIQKSPNKARAHNNLGHAYAMQGNWEMATEKFRMAARLDPDYALAQKNLREAYLHLVERD
jgi:tetratricopeptide (TPR) repeat protein